MKLGVACDGWEIKSSDEIEEVAKLQCEPVEHEGCSVCDPLAINTGIPCYKTVFVEELPEAGISGILYVTKTDDEYSIYEWDGSIFVNVTSPVSCTLQTKTVTPTASQVEYLPDSGYDGFEKFTVEAIPSEYIVPTGTKNITANGNAQDVAAYEYVNVNVPTVTPTGEKTINVSQNGTVTEDVTNYASAKVVTNVPNTYSASDEGKVVQNGALASQTSLTVNQNGTYVTTTNNEVVVDVSGGAAIAIEDVPNATGVECQITGDYSGGTVTQDENGYVVLSASGGVDLDWIASVTPTPSIRNFFCALANGTLEHGEFTLTNLPNDAFTDLFTMTNITVPQGILFVDKDFYQGENPTPTNTEAAAFIWLDKSFVNAAIDSDPSVLTYAGIRSMKNSVGTSVNNILSTGIIKMDGSTAQWRSKWQFSGKTLQIKNDYSNNDQYCTFSRNRTYIWMAY